MLQIKNIKPNSLINAPLVLDESNIGAFSFELEGNENVSSCNLIFTDLNFDINQDFSATISSSNYSNNLKEDYPKEDYTTPINSTNRPDLPDFPENLKLFLTFTYNFTLENKNKDFNVLLGNHKISYSFSIPYKIYCTHNGYKSSGAGYRARRVLSSQSIEESNNIIKFSDSCYIYDNQNETISITGSQTVDLSEAFNLYLKNIKDDSDSLGVYSDYVDITEPIGSFLKEKEYFPKLLFSFNNDSFLPLYEDSYFPPLGTETIYGALIYLCSPTLAIDNIISEKTYIKEIDKPYKTSFGKNNVFSFDIQMNDYLKETEKFYIDLKRENPEKVDLVNKKTGCYLGTTLPADNKDNLSPGDYWKDFSSYQTYLLQVKPGEKYTLTSHSNIFYNTIPLINFYNDTVPNNTNYIKSIFSPSHREETISFTIPSEVVLITINSSSYAIDDTVLNKNNYISPLISYNILKHPTISSINFERTFFEGSFNRDYDYYLSFYYNEDNQFPMLWYQVKIYNIIGENKTIIYNTDKVFTSVNQVFINSIHLLPNEEYQYEIRISDTQNMISTYISDEDLETSKAEEEINFSEQSIKKYLSESFIKLELNKFGIYQQGIYPGITLFPGDIYPKDNITIPSKYQKLKLLREDLVSKQATWIDEKEWIDKEPSYFIYDYGIKANTPYNYWAYAIDENGVLSGVKINNEPIVAEWDRWTLVTADKDPENEKVYHVDKVFTFEMNLSSGGVTNGTNITASKNFTEFPVIQKDKSNFYSGSLTALMGVRKWGSTAEDFEQTPQMLEDLRQLSTNYQPKFLKDRSGHLWRVEINGAIQVANTDNLATIDLKTMTVPWVQIGEADDISLIYTGTEKKEDLYC